MTHPLRPSSIMLTASQERELVEKMRAGDVAAHDKLITAHIPLALKEAKRFGRLLPRDANDLEQEASIGLLRAADAFDPSRGVRFAKCALYWIRANIYDFVRTNISIVPLPAATEQRRSFWSRLRAGTFAMDASLNVPLSPDGDVTPLDLLPDESFCGEDGIVDEMFRADQIARVLVAVSSLSEREATIIKRRHLCDEQSVARLVDLGREFGVSLERARQIEVIALQKVGDRLRAEARAGMMRHSGRRAA